MVRVAGLALVLSALVASAGIAEESGFRVGTNGFGFRNYGNDSGVTNLTPEDIVRLFGPGVNACPESSEVTLVPAAEEWMEQMNASIGGGHCEGLAVLSYLFLLGEQKPEDFGAPTANALQLDENVKLQREIAFWWATQCTDTTRAARVVGTPVEMLDTLRKALPHKDPEKAYTIAIWMPDWTGGHAVTPFAVVDTGDTHSRIMVYDNNFPNQERFINVNRAENTWSYSTAANPAAAENSYAGDANTKTLFLTPCAPRLKVQECAFLGLPPFSEDDGIEKPTDDTAKPGDEAPDDDDEEEEETGATAGETKNAPSKDDDDDKDEKDLKDPKDATDDAKPMGAAPGASPASGGSLLRHIVDVFKSTASEKKYSTGTYTMDVSLTGSDAELMIKDPQGRRAGFDHGKIVKEIPGAEFLWVTNARAVPGEREDPTIRLPGGIDYLISVTGTADKPEPVEVTCLARGSQLSVEDITVDKGQTDTVYFSPDGTRVAYRPSGSEHPSLVAGFASKGPDFEITAQGVETSPGATVELEIVPKTGCVKVQVKDTKETATVGVEIERMTEKGSTTYENDDLALEPNDAAYFHFAAWDGGDDTMAVDFDKGGDGKLDSVSKWVNEAKKK